MPFFDRLRIHSEDELREILGHPGEVAARKVIPNLDNHCREWIDRSPFLIMATADAKGQCEVSPRGDAPGFVHILDDTHLVI